jgi:Arc/MetJ family transcription regulator
MKRHVVRKTFRLDPGKVSKAQKVLGAASETEAVRMALDKVIDEDRERRKHLKAHREMMKSLDSENRNSSTAVVPRISSGRRYY